jgi:hypothetical protein
VARHSLQSLSYGRELVSSEHEVEGQFGCGQLSHDASVRQNVPMSQCPFHVGTLAEEKQNRIRAHSDPTVTETFCTRKIWGFHSGEYEEWRLLGCYAEWLL